MFVHEAKVTLQRNDRTEPVTLYAARRSSPSDVIIIPFGARHCDGPKKYLVTVPRTHGERMYQRGALYSSRRMVPTPLFNAVLPEGWESSPDDRRGSSVACVMLEFRALMELPLDRMMLRTPGEMRESGCLVKHSIAVMLLASSNLVDTNLRT